MQALEIVESVLKDSSPYKKTVYLLTTYKDLKNGAEINAQNRTVVDFLNKALELIKDDEYIDIIILLYVKGYTYEQTAEALNIDKRTLYRQRKRLIKRLAIIIYGDRAL